MKYPKEEHWSGLPFPSAGDLLNPGIEPLSPAWQADPLPLNHLGNPTAILEATYSRKNNNTMEVTWIYNKVLEKYSRKSPYTHSEH